MSVPDELIGKYYRLATVVPVDEVDAIEAGLADDSLHPNELKRRLGREIVSLYYDEDTARQAEAAFDKQFKDLEIPDDIPEHTLTLVPVEDGESKGLIYMGSLMAEIGLATSAGQARRLIDGGGVKIEGVPLAAKEYHVDPARLKDATVQVGKRKFAKLVN